jgi:hypothetical protein
VNGASPGREKRELVQISVKGCLWASMAPLLPVAMTAKPVIVFLIICVIPIYCIL